MISHPLRRADRALPREATLAILDEAPFITLSTIDESGFPYGVPLSFVRSDATLYFHTTNEGGYKFNCFNHDARACATAVVGVQPCFEDGDFSTSYQSAIAFGRIRKVTDNSEFKHALVDLCMKYLPEHKHDIGRAIQQEGPHTSVWALDFDTLTGKGRPGSRGEDKKAAPTCA